MMEDELLAIKERAALIQIMKKQIPYSSTIVRGHVGVIAFQTKIDNFMMLAQSKFSMKEHHHFELLTIDKDTLDILSGPYNSPIVIRGKWRVSMTQKNLFMMEYEFLAIRERSSRLQVIKNRTTQSRHNVNTISTTLSEGMWRY